MAAKDLDSGVIKKQELDDMTTCCICTEVFTNPKALPCIHTFCMKCIQETGLKNNKGPGDEMPCPICRRMFQIPPEGLRGLPKNFFIERLILASDISDQSASSRAVCDACLEDNEEEADKEIPDADEYCVECKHKLCKECCNEHRKFRFTKNHKLIPMTEHEGGQNLIANLAPSVCELHEQNVQNVYCADCKTVVCSICFIDDHRNHDGSHVNKFVDDFRKQIKSNVEAINEYRSKFEIKKADFLNAKEDIEGKVGTLECVIDNRKDKLKQLTDKHATSLLQGLCSLRQSKLKEIQMTTDDIDAYLSILETYNSYCQKILAKGSPSDICRSFSDLSVRAMELKQQCQPMIEGEIQSFDFCFRNSEVEEILDENCENWIGEIEEKGELKPKKRGKQGLLAEQRNEIDLLRKENMNLKQELAATKTDNSFRSYWIIRAVLSGLLVLFFMEYAFRSVGIISVDSIWRSFGLYEEHKDKLRYTSDPVLVQTIRTKAAEERKRPIFGLTILDKELFVLSGSSSEVEVYDSIKLSFSRRWNLKELIHPWDIGSCNINKCLYIFDYKGIGQSKEILRVDPTGNLIKKWSTGDDYGRLSVTAESNIILTFFKKNKLNEYSPDGKLIREINLSPDEGIRQPWHAMKLPSGHFMVTHGYYDDDLHRVCVVDEDGILKMSFGGKCGSAIGQMKDPIYFSVDGNGMVMVVDQGNSRILLLDTDLKFKRVILSKEKHGLRNPSRILLDESNDRVFLADNDRDSEKTYTDGRILVFDFI